MRDSGEGVKDNNNCFIIAPFCECDQRISTTFLVLHNPNNTTLSSRDGLTSASPSPLSSHPLHTASPPYQYGGRGLARGGVGKPNTPPHGQQL